MPIITLMSPALNVIPTAAFACCWLGKNSCCCPRSHQEYIYQQAGLPPDRPIVQQRNSTWKWIDTRDDEGQQLR